VVVSAGRYTAPTRPGFSSQMREMSLEQYRFPNGEAWRPDQR
jgi:L-fuconate dehydratase